MKALKIGYISLGFFLILDGLFPVVSVMVLKNINVLWLVTIATAVSLLLTIGILWKDNLFSQYKNKKLIIPTLFSSLGLGIGTLLYFLGMKYLNASLAAVLLLLQIPISFLFFNIFGKESYNYQQLIGSVLMFIGGFVVMYEGGSFLSMGSLIMLAACTCFVFGNFFTKKASLSGASPYFLLFNRNIFTVIFTGVLAYSLQGLPEKSIIIENIWSIIFIGFFFLLVAKVLWITSLKNLNSIIPISSFVLVAVFAIFFSYIILGEGLSIQQWIGLIPIFLGFFLLNYFKVS